MSQNIFQVVNEGHVDEILNNHQQELVIIMLSSKTCGPCKLIRPVFIQLAKQNIDCVFIYIDTTNYIPSRHQYTGDCDATPKFDFYFNKTRIAFVKGAFQDKLIGTLEIIKQKINVKREELKKDTMLAQQAQENMQRQQMLQMQSQQEQQKRSLQQQQQQQQPQQMQPVAQNRDNEKMGILMTLFDMMNRGIKLTKQYTMNSSYDELREEYEFQIKRLTEQNPVQPAVQPVVQPVVQPAVQPAVQSQISHSDAEHNETQLKQEQVKKLQELNRIDNMVKMQQLYRIQQLKKLHKLKEEQEKIIDKENERRKKLEDGHGQAK